MLFSDLLKHSKNGYGAQVSKWLNRYLVKVGVKDAGKDSNKKVFHSFRHTVIHRLQQKGVEEKHSISNLENLGVKQRLINLLESHKISNLEQLMFHKKETLLSIPNFGKRQLFVLFEALSKYNELENEYK
jgi:DNA-directed RNA polymerase alpha subunit